MGGKHRENDRYNDGRLNMVDTGKIRSAVTMILEAIGEDQCREGLQLTPTRVARLWKNFIKNEKLPQITKFESSYDDIQARRCDFLSFCEHHLVPMVGIIYVGYLPNKWIIGMDKIDLIVDHVCGRLQLQERICRDVADTIMKTVQPQGVIVQAYGVHFCAMFKGNNGNFATSAVRGLMRDDPHLRMEAIEMFKKLDSEVKI